MLPHRAIALVCCAAATGSLCAPTSGQAGAAGPVFVDLSESGEVFRFEWDATTGTATVHLRAAAKWDVLDFELRATPGQAVRFRVPDAGGSAVAGVGLSALVCEGQFTWRPARALSGSGSGPDTTPGATGPLAFEVTPTRPHAIVRLSRGAEVDAPFYPYSRFRRYIRGVINHPRAAVTQLGRSIQGRPLYRIVINRPSRWAKKTVLMVVRQHGNEDGCSYVLEGMLDYLLGRTSVPRPRALLSRIRWVIYPMANPDGAFANQRYNANGVDLNREWDRNGANPGQEPEIFTIQGDIERLQGMYPGGFFIGGDHHGWGSANHGGFRYQQGASVSFVTAPEYEEAKKDTDVITLHDPSQFAWSENGGTTGMLRAEMFHRYGFLLHTPEYTSSLSSAEHFHAKGRAWALAMLDTLYAPRFTTASGQPVEVASVPGSVHVTVDDFDENTGAGTTETVTALVFDLTTGDFETVTLTEVGRNTGVFRNTTPVPLAAGTAVPGDGVLQTQRGSEIYAWYRDDDYPRDSSVGSVEIAR